MEEKQLDFNARLLSVRRQFSLSQSCSDEANRKSTSKSAPDRQHPLPSCKSDLKLGEVTKPAAVPFLWEQIPGQPKSCSKFQPQPSNDLSTIPIRLPGRMLDDKNYALRFHDHEKGNSDMESEDDACSDARDTLPKPESYSPKCCESVASHYDCQDINNSQARGFTMNRFLAAARALVLETPPYYVSRKNIQVIQTVPVRQVKRVNSGEGREIIPSIEKNGPRILPYYGQYADDVESDGTEKVDDPSKKLRNICRFVPRFCVKNSSSILNPAEGMKLRNWVPASCASEIRSPNRIAFSRHLIKFQHGASHTKRFHSGVQSRQLHQFDNNLIAGSNRFYSLCKKESSPSRTFRNAILSSKQNKALRSPTYNGASFLDSAEEIKANKYSSLKKRSDSFQQALTHKQGSGSFCPAVFVDTVENSISNFRNPPSKEMKGIAATKFSVQDKRFNNPFEGGKMMKTKVCRSFKLDQHSSANNCTSNLKFQAEKIKGFKLDLALNQESRYLEYSEMNQGRNLDGNHECKTKTDEDGIFSIGSNHSSRLPPLPKSPSESWLRPTLNSISFQNPFPNAYIGSSHFYTKKQSEDFHS